MRAVVQRVINAHVDVENKTVGQIDNGFLVLLGVEKEDTEKDLHYIVDKVMNLRIFEDAEEKMNLSLKDVGGAILAVSQFTLLGDARGGRRPSFIAAELPEKANEWYEKAVAAWRENGLRVETGVFRTHMEVSLTNDGPVTLLLDSRKAF